MGSWSARNLYKSGTSCIRATNCLFVKYLRTCGIEQLIHAKDADWAKQERFQARTLSVPIHLLESGAYIRVKLMISFESMVTI